VWESYEVPEVLISGNHSKIGEWRLSKAEEKTKNVRPDLWSKYLKGVKNELS
jgi:tRNA (guanine37-N1)-methyltransferase